MNTETRQTATQNLTRKVINLFTSNALRQRVNPASRVGVFSVFIFVLCFCASFLLMNWQASSAKAAIGSSFKTISKYLNVNARTKSKPLTIGTCESLPGGVIEVEGTGGSGAQPTGYATLGAAFTAINSGVHTGAIVIDVCGDTSEGTATATLNASGSGAASYTGITVSPAGGAARTITGATTAGSPMIDFNGADNVTIDGLNTGGNSLTISNTTASATSGTSTMRFIGGATSNTITNSTLLGSHAASVATNGATIFFSTDAVTANGNDNNTISNNNIGPAGANLPTKAILGNGSTTTTAIGNSGIIINNNNIFDYFGAAVTSSGVATNGGCNAWSITNNRFYQTGTRTWTTGALHVPIDIRPTTATSGAQGFTITGNTIGFASNTQTGTYTLTGAGTGAKFIGILFNGIVAGTTTNVNGNTVAGVSMTGVTGSGTTTNSPFTGILLQEGNLISNNNTVGSQSATGSLTFSTTTTSATDVYGIHNFSSNAWTSNNNNVGGISVTNLGASGTFLLVGMRAFTGTTVTWTATSNTVGGTVANSMQLSATGAASQVLGMFTSNAPALLTSNTVRNLTSNIGTGTTTTASVIGIGITSTTPNSTLSQNTISGLTNTNATAATVVTGIQFNGATANLVERNLIHSLTSATNSAAAEVNGIRVAGGTTTYRNNMIAIGAGIANAIGGAASNSGTTGINGIIEASGTNSFLHNSVYIGGSPTAGTGASYAFNETQVTVTRSVRDNIFFNARSNAGATGKHYAIKLNGTAANPAGLTINNNLYFANGTGAVFGFFNSLDVANIAAWKIAVGQDLSSFESNPQYLDPTNAVPDLHIHPTNATVAEGNGVDVGVTGDFDGQTRASLTPVDIGADAGNFVGLDVAAPNITYTALANTNLTTNRVLSVTLTDVTGVATGGMAPRIYYRKNAGAYFSQACSLASGTVQNGSWNCTINNADLGGVVVSDVISYFVVAQDTLGNLASNPISGFAGTDVNTVTTPPTTPNSYLISVSFAGTKTVCASGCDYTTLTGATGIFNAINIGVATGNIEIQIAGDLTVGEDGTNGLNALAEEPAGSNFTIKMYPTGVARAITGSFNGALIRMNGSSRVTIDGSIGGTGTDRSLTITNTSATTPSVVLFGSIGTTPITNDILKNCTIINGVNTSSAVVISAASPLGNAGFFSNITIQNNDVQKAFVGVFAAGGTTPQGGSNLTYTQNTMTSTGANAIRDVGLYMQGVNGATVTNNTVSNIDKVNDENDVGIWLASGTINATVSGNTVSAVGYTGTGAFAPVGINVTSSTTGSTNNNVIGNLVSDITSNGSTQVRGIAVSGATSDLTIQKNNVQGIISTNTGTFGAYGIDISGGNNVVVKNNFVSNISQNMTGGSAFSTTFGVFGIRVGTGIGHQVYNNSVNLYGALSGTATTSLLSAAFALVGTTSTGCDVRNNIFANNITGGTTSVAHVSVFLPSGGTSAMNLTWNNNSYYFGTDAARQGIGQAGTTAGTNFLTTLPLLAAYSSTLSPAATNDNASLASTGAVPYTTANDLHIGIGAPEVNAGASIASVTDDFDGDMRPSMPDIGADEVSTTVSSINLAAASPVCGGTTVSWTVTFAASVTGLTTSNFALANTGLTSPMITGISGGGTTWTVTASTGTGSGLLGLNLTNSTGVTPAISPLPSIGQVYTINAPPTTANAGPDQTLCTTSPATLMANTPLSGTGAWTVVTGPSTSASQFSSVSSPTAMFTPAGGAGIYTLRWTISNAPCTASTDDVVLTYQAAPTVANAGPDQTLCTTSPATLAANTPSAGTGVWIVVTGPSTSAAQFSNTASPTATFTPAGGAGVYTLRWTISNAPCAASTDDVVLNYSAPPTVANAGPDQTLCTTSPATLAANAPTSGTGAWTVVTGPSTSASQFSNASSPTAAFTPAGGAGVYTLRWTISNAPCTASTDDVVLTYQAPPTAANAGPDQTLCTTSPATLAANTPAVGTGAWTVVTGPSTSAAQFSNTASPTATFTPAGGAGTYTLRWSISNAPCTASTDDVVITYSAPPTVSNAGPDQTLCTTSPATLAANAPSVGTGAWTVVTGPSTSASQFSNASSATATFTPAGGAGVYTLRWTISNAPCTASTDDVVLTYQAPPTAANAGLDQTICATCSATLAANAPSVGTGAWTVVTGPSTSAAQFSSATSTTATFTPAGGVGTYTLRWTISNAPCATSTDDVVIRVFAPTTVTKAFSPNSVQLNATSTLTITITNPAANPGGVTGVAINDPFPPGLEVDAAPMATNSCGGTFTANAAATSVSLTGGSIASAGGSCSISVKVKATTQGLKTNTTGAVSSTQGGAGLTATATLDVASSCSITCPSPVFVATTGNSAVVTYPAPSTNGVCGTITCSPASGASFNVGVTTVTCNSSIGNQSCSFNVTVNRVSGSAVDPLACTGPGNTVQATLVISNNGNVNQTVANTTTFTNLKGVPGSCAITPNVGTCVVTNGNLTYNATLTPGQTVTLTYLTQVSDLAPTGAQVCTNNSVAFNGGNPLAFSVCDVVDCPAAGPGGLIPAASEASDQKAGSVLIYNVYTSGATSGNTQNTRINITNTHLTLPSYVHLFFVAEGCAIADSYICLTGNQTASFLASDLDPGTTGYLVAVAMNALGCPTNFNYLIGDEYVKFTSGHAANLAAEAFASLPGGLPACDGNANTAAINFDGVSYNRAPATLSLDNIGSRADGNDTLLIVNRIGGNLGIGAASLGTLFGIFYDDAEAALSFSVTGTCQLRNSITNNFPRITPRFETFVPAGRTGWLKIYNQTGAIGITGAAINFNPNASSSAGAFNQGHNLHHLTLNATSSYTIPVFPPSC